MTSNAELFGLTLAVGAIPLAIKASLRIRSYWQVQQWPKVSATVIKSVVRETTDNDGTSYLPEFAFRYTVAGKEYVSTRHTDGLPFLNMEEAVRQMVERHPVGNMIAIAVSPADPGNAVVDTGFPRAWVVLRRISFAAIAAGIAIAVVARLHAG